MINVDVLAVVVIVTDVADNDDTKLLLPLVTIGELITNCVWKVYEAVPIKALQ